MDYTQPEPSSHPRLPKTVAGEWYLKGFQDAYHARRAVSPRGPAGEEYKRGYNEGLEAAQRDFFAATWN